DYTEPDDPWQSVKVGGSQDIVATILPSEATQRIYFTSSNPAEATVSPVHVPSSIWPYITITGVSQGDSAKVEANFDAADGITKAGLKVAVYDEKILSVAVRLVVEQNDDVLITGPYDPNTICITDGENKFLDSTIPAGSNDTYVTDPATARVAISTGTDSICDTTVNNTHVASTDLVGSGYPGGVSELQSELNSIYKQAVYNWEVTVLDDCVVNYDQDKDMLFDLDGLEGPEMGKVRKECGVETFDKNIFLVENPSKPTTHGLAFFNNRFGFSFWSTQIANYNAFVKKSRGQTIAHELGHQLGLAHTGGQPPNYEGPRSHHPSNAKLDRANLMYAHKTKDREGKLRKYQWDALRPEIK
ncbi:MAG: hypothetical protein GY820_15705, partial [Gammaproteobacteria bacterium]|nr:hypothetical protein [Gammaproteobacteria bacterium]